MVKAYDKYWHRLARAAHAPAAGCRMTQQEAGFYERQVGLACRRGRGRLAAVKGGLL